MATKGFWRHVSVRKWIKRLLIAWCLLTFVLVVPLRWLNPLTTSFILRDIVRTGEPVSISWTHREALGVRVPIAVIASEDQKFSSHHGFDMGALGHAIRLRFSGQNSGGASTISQQLSKNMWLWPAKSFIRKMFEAWFTLWVEIFIPKARILEIYLNVVELGQRNYGVEAASRYYFDTNAHALSSHQAALIAASLPNPTLFQVNKPQSQMLARARWIERQTRQLGGRAYLEGIGWFE